MSKRKNKKLVENRSKIGNYNMRKLINEKFVNERESTVKNNQRYLHKSESERRKHHNYRDIDI